jgi:hypothetical protein
MLDCKVIVIFQELIYTVIAAVLYMIAFIAQLSAWTAYKSSSSNITAGVRLIIATDMTRVFSDGNLNRLKMNNEMDRRSLLSNK